MSYKEIIKAAILALKHQMGSTPQAIKLYIVSNFLKVKFLQHALRIALKKGVSAVELVLVKHSYKLSAAAKKPVKAKKPKMTDKKVKKAKKTVKKSTKKSATKMKAVTKKARRFPRWPKK